MVVDINEQFKAEAVIHSGFTVRRILLLSRFDITDRSGVHDIFNTGPKSIAWGQEIDLCVIIFSVLIL